MSKKEDLEKENLEKKDLQMKWTKEHEKLFVEWADKALCYNWLHSKTNLRYTKLNTWFTIPVIVMSTLTGTANFAQEKLPEDLKEYAPIVIGCVNITAGIITTVQQFLKISELNEAHRVAALSWDKFYRRIKIELSKSPDERSPVAVFLQSAGEEYDRLMEISPEITESTIKRFNKIPGKIKLDRDGNERLTEKQEAFRKLKKPEICDSLESTARSVYKPPLVNINRLTELESKINKLRDQKDYYDKKFNAIDEFIKNFTEEYKREPSEDDIVDNFVNDPDNEIDDKIMLEYFKNKKNIEENTDDVVDNDNIKLSINN